MRGVGYRLVARGDADVVLVGERPAPPQLEAEQPRARPLSLVAGLDPRADLAVVFLSAPRTEPLVVLGRRASVSALINNASAAGAQLVELRRPDGAPVSVSPAHVVLVRDVARVASSARAGRHERNGSGA